MPLAQRYVDIPAIKIGVEVDWTLWNRVAMFVL